MQLIINKNDFAGIRNISVNASDDIVNEHIRNAQISKFVDYIGQELLTRIVNNLTAPEIVNILDEKDYTYKGKNYTSSGLKTVLVNLSYARYVLNGSDNDTPYGFVKKDSQYSQPTEYKILVGKSEEAENIAFADFRTVHDYLIRHSDIYPEYIGNCNVEREVNEMKFIKISR